MCVSPRPLTPHSLADFLHSLDPSLEHSNPIPVSLTTPDFIPLPAPPRLSHRHKAPSRSSLALFTSSRHRFILHSSSFRHARSSPLRASLKTRSTLLLDGRGWEAVRGSALGITL